MKILYTAHATSTGGRTGDRQVLEKITSVQPHRSSSRISCHIANGEKEVSASGHPDVKAALRPDHFKIQRRLTRHQPFEIAHDIRIAEIRGQRLSRTQGVDGLIELEQTDRPG